MSARSLPSVISLAVLMGAAVYAVPQLTGAGVTFSRTIADASGISGQLTLAEIGLGLSGIRAGGALRFPRDHSLRIPYQNECSNRENKKNLRKT